MNNWVPHLHWTFRQDHVLFPSLVLHSSFEFVVAALIIALICLLERSSTFALDQRWAPQCFTRSRWRKALWRTYLYWVATLLRLCYMLAAMTFQLGIILVIVTSLAFGQFLIECWKFEEDPPHFRGDDDECRVSLIQQSYNLSSMTNKRQNRPRSRSKPKEIFIHPAHSNVARANAAVLQLDVEGTMFQRAAEGETQVKHQEHLGRACITDVTLRKDEDSFLIGGSDSD